MQKGKNKTIYFEINENGEHLKKEQNLNSKLITKENTKIILQHGVDITCLGMFLEIFFLTKAFHFLADNYKNLCIL